MRVEGQSQTRHGSRSSKSSLTFNPVHGGARVLGGARPRGGNKTPQLSQPQVTVSSFARVVRLHMCVPPTHTCVSPGGLKWSQATRVVPTQSVMGV